MVATNAFQPRAPRCSSADTSAKRVVHGGRRIGALRTGYPDGNHRGTAPTRVCWHTGLLALPHPTQRYNISRGTRALVGTSAGCNAKLLMIIRKEKELATLGVSTKPHTSDMPGLPLESVQKTPNKPRGALGWEETPCFSMFLASPRLLRASDLAIPRKIPLLTLFMHCLH